MFKLILNKYIYLAFFFIAPSFCNPAEFKEEEVVCISTRQASLKSIAPAERMEQLKSTLANNPDMDMRTVLPELLGWWNRDSQFVRSQIGLRISDEQPGYYSSLSPSGVTLHRIQLIDTMVQNNADHMSLAFLNFAWRLVVNALSGKRICLKKDDRPDDYSQSNFEDKESSRLNEVVEEYKHMITGPFDEERKNFSFFELRDIYSYINTQPGAFVIAHISKQGFVSIPIINEGLAFRVNDRAYAVSFIGVGTNPYLEYDSESGDANGLWRHDHVHYIRNFPWTKEHEGKGTINDALAFKEKIENVYNTPEVQLALYAIFHEGNQNMSNEFEKNIRHCTENVHADLTLLPDFVKSASQYDPSKKHDREAKKSTVPLYLSAIKDAEWLKINWPHKNGGTPFFYPNDEKNKDELSQLLLSQERYRIRQSEIAELGSLGKQYRRFYLKGIELIKQELLKNYIAELDFGILDYKAVIRELRLARDHLNPRTGSTLERKEQPKP